MQWQQESSRSHPHTVRNSAWTASPRPSTIVFWSLSTVS
jgi:hypothetical protein